VIQLVAAKRQFAERSELLTAGVYRRYAVSGMDQDGSMQVGLKTKLSACRRGGHQWFPPLHTYSAVALYVLSPFQVSGGERIAVDESSSTT
jgi:hypothetical protein